MNSTQNTNPLKYQISKTSITFLDTEVYIKNNYLYTKTYTKNRSSNIPQYQL